MGGRSRRAVAVPGRGSAPTARRLRPSAAGATAAAAGTRAVPLLIRFALIEVGTVEPFQHDHSRNHPAGSLGTRRHNALSPAAACHKGLPRTVAMCVGCGARLALMDLILSALDVIRRGSDA
jgi:hypothetical protein